VILSVWEKIPKLSARVSLTIVPVLLDNLHAAGRCIFPKTNGVQLTQNCLSVERILGFGVISVVVGSKCFNAGMDILRCKIIKLTQIPLGA